MKDKIIKIWLVCLWSLSVLIASFASAEMFWFSTSQSSYSVPSNSNSRSFNLVVNSKSIGCIRLSSSDFNCELSWYNINITSTSNLACVYNNDSSNHNIKVLCTNSNSSSRNFYYYGFSWDIITCPTCPSQYTENECKSVYWLIDESECIWWDCPSCPVCPDTPENWFSNVYVNDILHPGAFNIVINIPDEIDRDYAYTWSWTNFNLDVVWYNQDTEYITAVIDQQNYAPTSEDFTRLVGMLPNYAWLLVACLFVILVFYLIKKSFK